MQRNLIYNSELDGLAPWDSRLILDEERGNILPDPHFEDESAWAAASTHVGPIDGMPGGRGITILTSSTVQRGPWYKGLGSGVLYAQPRARFRVRATIRVSGLPANSGVTFYVQGFDAAGTRQYGWAHLLAPVLDEFVTVETYLIISASFATGDCTVGLRTTSGSGSFTATSNGGKVEVGDLSVEDTLFDDVPFDRALRTVPGQVSIANINNFTSQSEIVPGRDYLFSVWLKADRPDTNFYLEWRTATSHAATSVQTPAIERTESTGAGAYLINNRRLNTEWTRYTAIMRANPDSTLARLATAYFNHTNGLTRDAVQWIGGISLTALDEPARPKPTLEQAIAGPRSPSWQIWLLNQLDQPVRQLRTIRSGQVNLSATDRLGGDASLTIDENTAAMIDWQADRVRIIHDPGIPGVEPWSVGTYLFSSPTYRRRSLASGWDVQLQTKMLIIDQATTGGPVAIDAGTNLVQAAFELIESTGETAIAATPSPAAASSPIIFEPGDSLLTVINTLLEAADYWGLRTDGDGIFQIVPYVRPADRPDAWTFAAGELALHSADWDREQDQSSVPNRVEVYTAADEDTDPIIGVATNTNPDSPYSYQERGRWITRREQVEAASQVEADALAARYLLGAMSPVAKLSVSHAMLPITPRQAVSINTPGLRTRATIQKMSFSLDFDTQVDAEWNEILDTGVGGDLDA